MATLTEAAAFAKDPMMLDAVTAGIVAQAMTVMLEDPATVNHQDRELFARMVLANPISMAADLVWAMSSNAGVVNKYVTGDKPGAILLFPGLISGVWNTLAGAAWD